ncbi:N-6 DNA Methylase [Sphingobium sp. AP50]|uniref:DNA methyltransferase n=1 Tax=Sphingobium sp. AP50 TaxID=1884369 RepID=UPI0008C29655|nr:DNA methyltransferase [Sphingobium sp. AP50]SEK01068.1 N-6 DNA Methylase [Sphingobium sp. AP50]
MTVSQPEEMLRGQIERLLGRLGYDHDRDFRTNADDQETLQLRHALEVAFDRIGVVGALCPRAPLAGEDGGSKGARSLPVVYVIAASGLADAEEKHRAVWSQSVVPQILMAMPDGFQVRNGYDYRAAGPLVGWEALDNDELPASLTALTSLSIRSSRAWSDFQIGDRVDGRIARDIRNLSLKVRAEDQALADRQDIVNAVIGRFLYLYVLVDRQVIDQAWVSALTDGEGIASCPSIQLHEGHGVSAPPLPWPTNEVWSLFDAIDQVLNGSVFAVAPEDRRLVSTTTMHLVRRVLRSDEIDRSGRQQYAFIDVDYSTIRTETISAIYECFFELEGEGERQKHGAYFTPAFVVDYIMQEVDRIAPLSSDVNVIDPACGSGAFLVGAYRNILERRRAARDVLDPGVLRKVLTDCIRGIELKDQAANVARFSLYLTMLDYLPGRTLPSLQDELGEERLFPDLTENILNADAFAPLPGDFRRAFTHVLGNPPWKKAESGSLALEYEQHVTRTLHDTVVDEHNLAELFFWRASQDLAKPDGAVIAFVIPSKCFIAPSAVHFAHAVANRTRLLGLANLTSFRRKLFEDAEEAATIVFVSPQTPQSNSVGWRYSPKLASQPVGADGRPWAIVVDRGQVERFHQVQLMAAGHQWYRDFLLQPLDRRVATSLETTGKAGRALNFEGFLAASGMHVSVGETYSRTGLPQDLVLGTHGANDFRKRLGLDPSGIADLSNSGNRQAYEIDDATFAGLSERLRLMFRGPTMFLPRSQARPYVVGRAAYNASIQGIYFKSDLVAPDLREAVLEEVGSYFSTAVGRYLISIFGRQWIADQRRFETPDLKRLPFPYLNYAELLQHPISGFQNADGVFDEEGFAYFAARQFGVEPIFAQAALEHRSLREPFQNGKRSHVATSEPSTRAREIYEQAIRDELKKLLAGTPLRVISRRLPENRSEIQIVLAAHPDTITLTEWERPTPDLAMETCIDLRNEEDHAIVRLFKPDVATAFTAERAYADAIGVANRIMAG